MTPGSRQSGFGFSGLQLLNPKARILYPLILIACLWVLPVVAQVQAPVIDDPDRLFGDGAAVRAAVDRLAAEGADVVVIAVSTAGPDAASAQKYVDDRLAELNLAASTRQLRGNQIVFYVAPQPGYHGIYFVSRYRDTLQPVYEQIGRDKMQPLFTSGDLAGGMAAGIDAVRTTINPPTSPLVPIGVGVLALGAAGAVAAPILRKRKAAASEAQATRQRLDEARRAAGVALADVGRLVEETRAQAQYDRVSYTPDAVERITQFQQRGEAIFTQAQSAFDAAEDAAANVGQQAGTDMSATTERFLDAQRLAGEAADALREATRLRETHDQATDPNTGETRPLQ